MRRAVWQWLLMGFVLVWGASGCNCGEPPVESQLEVAFDRPKDGDRLALADDADPATDGFQYEVVAIARDTADRPVKLASAKLELRTPSEQTWTPGPEAVIDGGTVRFPGTLLQARTNVLQVTVEEEGSRRTATQRISVAVSTEAPTVDLTQPAEGQVLREADDADPGTEGYQLRFTVKSTGLAGKTGTLYCEQACGVPPTDFTVNSSGVTQLSVTLAQAACEAEQAACYAVVRNGDSEVTSTKRNITLDTVAPKVEVVAPLAPVASTTFRVEATVGCIEPGVIATLSRPGAADLSTPVVGGAVSFPAVTVPVDGEYLYTLRVADEGGNVTTREIPVTVASTPPTLQLLVQRTITSDGDTEPLNGVQAPVSVQVNGQPVGTEVRLFTAVPSVEFERPQRAVTAQVGGNRAASFTANLAEGQNTLQACVSNAAGIEQCVVETVTVTMGRPMCRIISPENGILLRGLEAEIRVESEAGLVEVVARDASGAQRAQDSASATSGPVALSLTLPSDGEYSVVATCPGTNATSQALSLGADTTAPTLSFNVRGLPAGQTTLGLELNDTSLSPGMQIALDVSTEPRASVTASGCGMTAGVTGRADAGGALVLRDVSVPLSGTCELQVSSVDLVGNVTTQTRTLTLAFSGGELRFLSPDVGRYLGAADGVVTTPGAGLTVSVVLAVTPTADGTLRLLRGTTLVASTGVAASDTEKTFTDVALEEGANVLRAELVGPGGTTACATVLLLVDTEPGNISLEIPAPPPAPAPVYIVSTDVTPGRAGIQYQLRYSAPGRSPSAVVDLCTDVELTPGAAPCRDGSGWFTLASNVPAFTPDFTYPDGRYTLKAVLDDGGISVSQEVPIRVDSTEPVVRSVELVGDTNNDKRLNAMELPTGAPQLRIAVDGVEPGRLVQVRDEDNQSVIYGQATINDGLATVSLSSLPTGVAAPYSLVITVTDEAGNSNRIANPTAFYPVNTAAFFSFHLDRVLPTLVVNAPTRNALGIADDSDPDSAGFQLSVKVNTDADVGTSGVRMELTPSGGAVELTPSELEASHVYTLPGSGKVTYTLTITATDTSGNSVQVVRSIVVDLEAPTVDLVTPMADTSYGTPEVPVRVDVGGGDVGSVRVFTQLGTGPRTSVGELTVTGGVAQGTLNFPIGVQTVSVEASDASGNTASDSVSGVEVRGVITITTPSSSVVTLLPVDDRDTNTPGLQYRLIGNTLANRGRTVSLYRGSAPVAEASAVADPTTGDFFFDVEFNDGEQTRLTVEVFDVDSTRHIDFVDVTVDTSPPVITSVSPAGTTLYFVANTNAFLFPTPAPDRVVDAAPGGDANATFTLTVTQATGGTVQAFYLGNAVSSEFSVTESPQTLDVPVTLPQDTAGTLELRVRDPSGSVVSHTVAATVDVVAPAAPTVTRTLVTGQERTAQVRVTWTPSGDDGVSGVPVGYDLRWTTNALLANGIPDQAAFFGPKVRQETGNLLPPGTTSYTLTLPPLARYFIQLRPRDEIGNYAPFTAETPDEVIKNFWTSVELTNPGTTGNFFALYVTSRGDLNADGFDDLVVAAASGAPGSAYIYYGNSNPAANPPIRQDLSLPETGSQFFGADFDVGDAGNPTADVVQDLLVGSRGYSGNSGRAFLYFGRKNTTVDTTGPIEFRGSAAGANLGGTVKMIGDITGDGLQELALSSHAENPPKVYIFYGRSPDAWRALGTGCSASAPCVVSTSSADKIITGPANTPTVNFFGRNRGYARLGDITGDGVADFTIPHSYERLNNLYVYSGSTVRSANPPTLGDALQVLHQGPDTGGNLPTSFGTEALGGVNLAGGPGLDLVVGQALHNKVYVFRDGGPSGFTTAPLEILGGGRLGNSLAQGDLNGDGLVDLAIGQNQNTGGSAFVFYNRGVPGAEFDTQQENGFSQSKLESATALGITLTILDFNGDGKPDLAAGDSQSSPARVIVHY